MATRYWVGGTGNWSDATNHWATASNGTPNSANLPTSADDVVFDANSNTGTTAFTVTVDGTLASPSICANFSTSSLDGAMTVSMSATAVLYCYSSMTLPAANLTWTGVSGAALYFVSNTTGKIITTNGVTLTLTHLIFAGVGGAWTLGSAISCNILYTNYGTFNTGNFNITCNGFVRNQSSSAGTVNLGSSAITCSGTTAVSMIATSFTFNAGTSTITCSNAAPTFTGAGFTFYNVSFTSAASGIITIAGVNTFNNFTVTSRNATGIKNLALSNNQTISGTLTLGVANTAIRRIRVYSPTTGVQRTITLNGTLATMADCEFRDIATAGTAGTWSGTRIGNGLNNSGITFDAAKTVYWNLAGTQNWSATGWATSNNGTPAVNNFPLAQDTAVFTEAGAAGTVNMDIGWFIGTLQMADGVSNRTTAFTFGLSSNIPQFHGNVTLFSNLVITATAPSLDFYGYGISQTFTSANITLPTSININALGGTFRINNNLTLDTTFTFTLTQGTLDLTNNGAGNYKLTTGLFSSSNSNTRSIAFGTGNITVTGNSAVIWNTNTATGFTYTGTPTVNCTYAGSTGTRTIAFNAISTGGTESNALSLNVTAGSDIVTFGGSGRSYKNINFTGFTGSYTNSAVTFFGNIIFGSGMTVSSGATQISFSATSGTQQITTNDNTLDFPITQNGVGGTVQLQDNLTMGSAYTLTLTNGTLDLNNKNVSVGLFSSNNSNTRSLLMGSGTFTLTGTGTVWAMATTTGMTLVPATSTIVFNGSGIGTFNSGGLTYNNLTQASSNDLTIFLSNTFNTISNTVSPTTITFQQGQTTTVSNFNVNGTAGNLVTINSSTAGTQGIISKASGTVNVSYVSLQDNNATGGAIWQAPSNQGNTIVSNVTGWFTSALYADAVTENSQPADVSTTQTNFNSDVTEDSQPADSSTVQAIFKPAIIESMTNVDIMSVQAKINRFVNENMVMLEQSVGYGWFKVVNSQTITWTNVNNAQSVTWTNVGNTQNPNWVQINNKQP